VIRALGPLILLFAAAALAEEPAAPVTIEAARAYGEDGLQLRFGALFKIQDGWHIYWRNPGEAGLPTELRLSGAGREGGGELQWPVPVTFSQQGRCTGYGYSQEVLIWFEIAPPPDPRELLLDASWLACGKSLCVPGRASVKYPPPGSGDRRGVFAEWTKRLPLPAAQAPFLAGVESRVKMGASTIRLRWPAPPGHVEWFPYPPHGMTLSELSTATKGSETTVTFTLAAAGRKLPAELTSVAAVQFADGERRGVVIRSPLE